MCRRSYLKISSPLPFQAPSIWEWRVLDKLQFNTKCCKQIDKNTNTFLLPRVHTVNYGTETVRYRGQRLWRSLPQEIKDAGSVQQFKNKIKFWKNDDCDCKLCKQYISQLGFLVI